MPGHAGLNYRPADIVQEDITPTNARITNNRYSNVQTGKEHVPTGSLFPKRTKQRPHQCHNEPRKNRTARNQLPSYWQRMGHIGRTGSGETAPFMSTINSYNHIRNHQANNGSKYKTIKANSKELNTKAELKSEPAKVVPAPQQTTNAWTKPFVPSMKEFPVATSANRTRRSFSSNQ